MINKKNKIGSKIIIYPGTYRETLAIYGHSTQSPLPITFEAATTGTVFISGAVQYNRWNPFNGNNNIYTSKWTRRWGLCLDDANGAPYQADIVRRREIIAVNGTPVTQVTTLSQMVFPGTFFVDEGVQLVYLWPPQNTDMNSADVEVASEPKLLTLQGTRGVALNGIVFRGITFEYANSCHRASAVNVQGSATNILFDQDRFIWNNGQGIAINNPASQISVTNSVANHNGATGFQAFQAKDILWQNDEASYNNWRGAQGAYYDWNTGGFHLFSDHNETLSGSTANFNQTFSVHWDTDGQNVVADSFHSAQNYLGALFEKNQGPLTVTNSQFCSSFTSASGYGGFVLRNSEGATFTNNLFYNNASSQLLITGIAGGLASSNWETRQNYNLVTQNITLLNNIIDGVPGQRVFQDSYLGGSDWNNFVSTLRSDNNTWWNPASSSVFSMPVPRSGTVTNLSKWQNATGQDLHSSWSAPAADPNAACAATADGPDFWLVTRDASQTANAAGNAVFTLWTMALGGLNGAVTLAADGISDIPGAAVTFSPASLATSGTSTVTFSTDGTTPPGVYDFTVLANTGDITHTLALQATVPGSSVRVSTAALAFNNQPVNTVSPPQDVTLSNTGSSRLQFSSITIGSGFSQKNTCLPSLAAGTTCTISVSFAPDVATSYQGSLKIYDSDNSSPQLVALTGTTAGVPLASLSPSSLSFGTAQYGTAVSLSTSLSNPGTANLSITSISLGGPNAVNFSQTNNCGPILAPGNSCQFTVTFTPQAQGQLNAGLLVVDDAANSPQQVTLDGTGTVGSTGAPLTFDATLLNFQPIAPGQSAQKTLTLFNPNGVAVPIIIAVGGKNGPEFSQTNNCGSQLAPNSSCAIAVTFTPATSDLKTGALAVKYSDPSSPLLVSLYCKGSN